MIIIPLISSVDPYITWLASAGTLSLSLPCSLSLSRNSLVSVYDAVVLIFKSAFIV